MPSTIQEQLETKFVRFRQTINQCYFSLKIKNIKITQCHVKEATPSLKRWSSTCRKPTFGAILDWSNKKSRCWKNVQGIIIPYRIVFNCNWRPDCTEHLFLLLNPLLHTSQRIPWNQQSDICLWLIHVLKSRANLCRIDFTYI